MCGRPKSRGLAVHMSYVLAHNISWTPKDLRGYPQNVMGIHTYRVDVQESLSLDVHTIAWERTKLRGHPDDCMAVQRLRGRVWMSKAKDFPWLPNVARNVGVHLALGRPTICGYVDVSGRVWMPKFRGHIWMSVDTYVGAQRAAVLVAHVAYMWTPIIVEPAGCPCALRMDAQRTLMLDAQVVWTWTHKMGAHVHTSMPRAVDTPISHTSSTTKLFTRRLRLVRQVFQNFLCSNA